jgi:hypothetical protein
MLETLMPLHALLAAGPVTHRELAFQEVIQRLNLYSSPELHEPNGEHGTLRLPVWTRATLWSHPKYERSFKVHLDFRNVYKLNNGTRSLPLQAPVWRF